MVVLCNLKPAKLRGFESAGMVLAATSVSTSGTEKVHLLLAPLSAPVGTSLFFAGHPSVSGASFAQVKKCWEAVQPGLMVSKKGVAVWKDGEGTEVMLGCGGGNDDGVTVDLEAVGGGIK